MKTLKLQCTKGPFYDILEGKQKIEHRLIYPSNEAMYVSYECEGVVYKHQKDLPDGDAEVTPKLVKYDALTLINGRKKDAPRLTVKVEKAEWVLLVDENDEPFVDVLENGKEYVWCQVWYYLGEVISSENIK